MEKGDSRTKENLLIVKGRFKSEGQNLYGLFLLMFTDKNTLSLFHIIVSSYSDMYEKEPHVGWEKYEEYIIEKKWKGVYNNSMTASLVDAMQVLADDKKLLAILYDHVYNYDYDLMDVIIYDIINRIIHDKKLYMESIIQEITQEEYNKVREERDKKSEEERNQSEEPQSPTDQAIILQITPIVAPVKGKPLYLLKIGDQVMIKITPGAKENHYIDLYDLKTEKSIKPVPGTVVDIKSISGKNEIIEILIEIAPGIFGKFIEEERQVKLRMFNPTIDKPLSSPKASAENRSKVIDSGSKKYEGINSKSVLIMGLFLILILFLLFFLIIIL